MVDSDDNSRKDKEGKGDNSVFSPITGRCFFPWLLLLSAVQFTIFLNKLYQDSAAVREYFEEREINFCAVSVFCFFLPVAVYMIYTVSLLVKNEETRTSVKEIGSEVLNSLLLIPQQIKGRIELMEFAASRACTLKSPTNDDGTKTSELGRKVSVVTFFETFYAGLTQILLQLYIIISSLNRKVGYSALTGEIIASSLCLLWMILSVRRGDDGPLTMVLSTCGWTCIIISRSFAISLATTVIWGWMALLCIIHGLGTTVWIYDIAVRSYSLQKTEQNQPKQSDQYVEECQITSVRKKVALFWLIFAVLGLPSLVYWPIMFQLQDKSRPKVFLCILFIENLLLIFLWATLSEYKIWEMHDCMFVAMILVSFFLGAAFIFAYIPFKPGPINDIIFHDMKRYKKEFGMFAEFCVGIFHIKEDPKVLKILNEIRSRKCDV